MGSKLKCRVCGNLYTGCRSAFPNDGVFRWQTVTCSPECGQQYLDEILKSREPEPEAELLNDEFADDEEDELDEDLEEEDED